MQRTTWNLINEVEDDEDLEFDTEYTEYPVCLHCGRENQDWWDGVPAGEAWEKSWQSGCACGNKYAINMSVRFCTSKELDLYE